MKCEACQRRKAPKDTRCEAGTADYSSKSPTIKKCGKPAKVLVGQATVCPDCVIAMDDNRLTRHVERIQREMEMFKLIQRIVASADGSEPWFQAASEVVTGR